jgi:NSS family neurotransmitter:Na+ symporter
MSKNQLSEAHHPRPQWKSRMGFILAALGSAVGLGNIWRFSYLCYKNGGGAFLIPYLVALLVIGIPLLILELGIGHKMRGSAPMSFAKVHRGWEWLGWFSVLLTMFGIMLYYSTVIAWCVSYVFFSFDLSWGADPNAFFYKEYLQLGSGPFDLGHIQTNVLLALVAVWFMCWFIVYFGVQKGVERANKIFMPLLFGLILFLVLWSVSLEGAMKGIKVYLTPDFSALTNRQIWIDAFTQIFFTLSLGFGIMVAYASYLPRKANIVRDGLIIAFGNSLFSFVAGFAVFGTLGYMATVQGVEVSEVVDKSIGLAFVTYPKAISLMPAFAKLFGVLFFSSLVIAGLSSAVSIIEAFSSAIIDKFHYGRRSVVTFLSVSGFAGSIIFTAQSGLYWLDILDHFITNYGLVIVAILQCVLVGWIYKASKLREHLNKVGDMKLHPAWDVCVKYVVPGTLILLIINGLNVDFSKAYEGYPVSALLVIGKDWLVYGILAAFILALKPWKKEPQDLE